MANPIVGDTLHEYFFNERWIPNTLEPNSGHYEAFDYTDKFRFDVLNGLPRARKVFLLNDLKMLEVKISGFGFVNQVANHGDEISAGDVDALKLFLKACTHVHAYVAETHDDGLKTSMVQAMRALGHSQATFEEFLIGNRRVPEYKKRHKEGLAIPIQKIYRGRPHLQTYHFVEKTYPERFVPNVPLATPDPSAEDLSWIFILKIVSRDEKDGTANTAWININCAYDLKDIDAGITNAMNQGGVDSRANNGMIVEVYIKLLRTKKTVGAGKKRLISAVIPEDSTCLQQSVVLLVAYYLDYKRYKLLNKQAANTPGSTEHSILKFYVDRVSSLAGIDTKLPCGLEEAKKICLVLSKLYSKNVVIFCFSGFRKKVVWRTTTDIEILSADSTLFLDVLLEQAHFTPMTHMHLLLGNRRHFCRICCNLYDNASTHACRGSLRPASYKRCVLCFSKIEDHVLNWKQRGSLQSELIECKECNRYFANLDCLERHKKVKVRNKTICASKWRCTSCDVTFRTPHRDGYSHQNVVSKTNHVCGQQWCKSCKQWTTPSHTCYLQTQLLPKQCDKVFYYDFETVVHQQEHVPVLCVVNEASTSDYRSFWDIQELCNWMLSNPGTYVAHNAQSFDSHLLIQQFICRTDLSFKFSAVNGNKILSALITSKGSNLKKKSKVCIRLIDSLCFLPFGLRKFSKTFGVSTVKGYFPYRFATEIGPTLSYVGVLPPRTYFDIPLSDEKSFEDWYKSVESLPYNLADEMLKYCVDDVRLLKLGCESFRGSFLKATGVDPFSKCTIAGACSTVFNSRFLHAGSMEILKVGLDRRFRKHFVGGRTEVFRLHYKCKPGERLQYVDFCSLYPWVNKYCSYPSGQHEAYDFESKKQPFDDELLCLIYSNGAGLFEVDITPPDDLWLPLLHSKQKTSDGTTKLFFDLRKKTKAIYTSVELKKALSLGYVITRIYYVWWWKLCTKGFGGSSDYMNTFLKLKQEASGWPESVVTSEDKTKYINEYKQHEGILLDPENISKNPGLRLVSKLCLNSLWGRQGMKPSSSFSSKHLIYDDDEGVRTVNELRTRIQNFHILGENCALFNVKGEKESDDDQSLQRSLVSAMFTTAHARLKLYSVMEKLGSRLCYCDTDSVIFIDIPGKWKPPLGKFLGDLTNELGSDNYSYSDVYATEFVGVSSKSYALKTNHKKHDMVKVKGHSLSRKDAREKLTFDTLKDLVYNKDKSVTVNYQNNIKRGPDFHLAHQDMSSKIFRWTFDKRVVQHLPNGGGVFTQPHK